MRIDIMSCSTNTYLPSDVNQSKIHEKNDSNGIDHSDSVAQVFTYNDSAAQMTENTTNVNDSTSQVVTSSGIKPHTVPTIVVIDDCDVSQVNTGNPYSGFQLGYRINGNVSKRKVDIKFNNQLTVDSSLDAVETSGVTRDTDGSNQIADGSDLTPLINLKPSSRQPRSKDIRLPVSNSNTSSPKRSPQIRIGTNASKDKKPEEMNYFHRRSHSHPENLNLVIDNDDNGSSLGGISNGDLYSSVSLLRKHSFPQESYHQSNRSFPFTERETNKFYEETQSTRSPNQTDEEDAFMFPVDETDETKENPWSRPSEFKLRDQFYSFFQASDNKLAMKLFGSRNALLKEKQRQRDAKSWIIHPCSNFR